MKLRYTTIELLLLGVLSVAAMSVRRDGPGTKSADAPTVLSATRARPKVPTLPDARLATSNSPPRLLAGDEPPRAFLEANGIAPREVFSWNSNSNARETPDIRSHTLVPKQA